MDNVEAKQLPGMTRLLLISSTSYALFTSTPLACREIAIAIFRRYAHYRGTIVFRSTHLSLFLCRLSSFLLILMEILVRERAGVRAKRV
jgi:hypothetical protein